MIDASNDTSLESSFRGEHDSGGMADLALPVETEAPSSSTPLAPSSSAAPAFAASGFDPTQQPAEQPPDNTVAVALVAAILIALVLFTVAYVLYQKRRRLCDRDQRQADKGLNNKPDLSANEALITPVKANGGVESVPDGGHGGRLVSGLRESKSRQAAPRKWYDSAALKYMDQSTDTLDRV